MSQSVPGIIHGNTIELSDDPGLAEGQAVDVVVHAATRTRVRGEGILKSAGALASEWTDEDDRILAEIYQERMSGETDRGISQSNEAVSSEGVYEPSSALMDAYSKLRPWTEIEACECETVHGLFLVDILTDNPIHCECCRCEVDPQRLQLTAEETDSIARWYSAADALYRLWLDSGEYESYAKDRLLDPNGQVNAAGLAVARTLSSKYPTRLWFFHDTEDGEPTHCPVCGNLLDTDVKWGTGKCAGCRIQI